MIEALDHIAVAVKDLDRAASAYGALLGRKADWREEASGARHVWFQLTNMALDIVQADGRGESGDRVRAQIGAHGEGLWGLAFAVDDLAETSRMLGPWASRPTCFPPTPGGSRSSNPPRPTASRSRLPNAHGDRSRRRPPPARCRVSTTW